MKTLKALLLLTIFIILVPSPKTFSQTITPSPTPPVSDDNDVVKITTSLVQVDATVTDKSGKVVSDLKPEDFEIYENGKKRTISGFTFVNGNSVGNISNNLLTSANSIATQNPDQNIEQVRRIYAFVVDDLRLSKTGVDRAKKDLKRFVEQEVQPNDLVTIIRTSTSVNVLQSFTNNKKQLLDAVAGISYNPRTSVGFGAVSPISISFSDASAGIKSAVSLTENAQRIAINQSGLETLVNTSITNIAGNSGLQTLLTTVRAIGNLKGRKAIFFVSQGYGGGFTESGANTVNSANLRDQTLFGSTSVQVEGRTYTIDNFLRAITEAANRNSVTIFPIDPNGAIVTNLSAEDNTRGTLGADGAETLSGGQIDSKVRGRNDDIRNNQQSLKYLARETGGKAFINGSNSDNDLRDAINNQSSYYLIAYEPDQETFDPKENRFNKLEIKAKRSNTNVTFRTGFFNVVKSDANKGSEDSLQILKKIFLPYNNADIGIELANVYAGTDKNQSTVRTFVNVNPRDLDIKDAPDGKKNLKIDVYAVVFDESGRPVGSSARNYGVTFDAKSYNEFLKSGLVTSLAFNVPQAGVYRIKVLVKDDNSEKIGTASQSVLIPDAEKQAFAFSGILLQNFTAAEWQALQAKTFTPKPEKMQIDTAFRHYKKGTVLTYNYGVNLFAAAAKKGDSKLTLTMKLLKENQVVFSGTPEDLPVSAGAKVNRGGAFNLGTEMTTGKYTSANFRCRR